MRAPEDGPASMERGLTVSQDLLKAVDLAVPPAFAIDAQSFTVIAANGELLRLLGRSRTEVLGESCRLICGGASGDSEHPASCPMQEQLGPGRSQFTDVSLLTRSGDRLPARLTEVFSEKFALIMVDSDPRPSVAAVAPAGYVWVRSFGRFVATLPPGDVVRPRRPQTLSLLKLLLAEPGKSVEEQAAVYALWPHREPRRAIRRLQVLVHDLRRALEPDLIVGRESQFIERRGTSYVIPENAPLVSDIDQFVAAAEQARLEVRRGDFDAAASHAREALTTYTGDLFAPDPPEEWFRDLRKHLRSLWLDTLTVSASLHARAADRSAAIAQCRRAIEADLTREDAHRLLLVLLARETGRAAAGEHFVEMFATFKRQIGLAPSREIAELVERIVGTESLDAIERDVLAAVLRPSEGSRGG